MIFKKISFSTLILCCIFHKLNSMCISCMHCISLWRCASSQFIFIAVKLLLRNAFCNSSKVDHCKVSYIMHLQSIFQVHLPRISPVHLHSSLCNVHIQWCASSSPVLCIIFEEDLHCTMCIYNGVHLHNAFQQYTLLYRLCASFPG